MMTPISKREEEIIEHYENREKAIMKDHKKMTDDLKENYELRLEHRFQYELTLLDEIQKCNDRIWVLNTVISGLVVIILTWIVTNLFI